MKHNRKAIWFCLWLCIVVAFLSQCSSGNKAGNDPRGTGYVGSESCRTCHKDIYDGYKQTAHFNATREASPATVLGSFQPPANQFSFSGGTLIKMEQRDSGMYQVAHAKEQEQQAMRFDIVFGLKNAQTSLTWRNDRTYELPVSYYHTVNGWATSPGFPADHPNYRRFIGANCFECHSSYIQSRLTGSTDGVVEVLDRKSLVYGIDCERCHGPAINHVNYHEAYPEVKQAKYITTITSLSRQQKLDVCAVCHSGNDKSKEMPTFLFRPGDTLANYYTPWQTASSKPTDFDVHGNQYQLLSESQCFLKSKTLDCSTCHNPHSDATGNLATYSAKCTGCHAQVSHTFIKNEHDALNAAKNCIDCHMPKQASRAITFQVAGSPEKSAYLLRTHKIAIYPANGNQADNVISLYKSKTPGLRGGATGRM